MYVLRASEVIIFGIYSVAVFFGGHSDKLLGSFGNVVGTLDDLLSDQLDV